jgi:hypothetical protein
MGWKNMHWEKVPMYIDGKRVIEDQLDELARQDIPVRLVRARQKDGKEVLYYQKLVSDETTTGRDCDIEGVIVKLPKLLLHKTIRHITQLLCVPCIIKTFIQKKVLINHLT